MSIGDKLFSIISSEEEGRDIAAIHRAIKLWKNYKKREAEASEAERKEAEEALQFLKLNDNDPT